MLYLILFSGGNQQSEIGKKYSGSVYHFFPLFHAPVLLYYCCCIPATDSVHLPFSSYITWSPRNSMKAI